VRSLPALIGLCFALCGCGARTPIPDGERAEAGVDAPPPVECEQDSDCEGAGDLCFPIVCDTEAARCVERPAVVCNDTDPCTEDSCDPVKGTCVFTPRTLDNDKDGRKGPLPGYKAGTQGSCGDDCDDTSPAAFPGAGEQCDGVDNDCNGVVDDGASFVPAGQSDVQVDETDAPSGPAGLSFSGSASGGYMASYTGTSAGKTHTYLQRLSVEGQKLGGASQLAMANADASGGASVWVGDRYGIAWYDRRTGDYEVYFNQVAPDGTKLGPDVQLTFEYGFSIYPQIAFNGVEYVVVWQDERYGEFAVFAQRIGLDGQLVGDNELLTDEFSAAEAPAVAVGNKTIGVAYGFGGAELREIKFRLFDTTLQPIGLTIDLTAGGTGVFPTMRWNEDRYVVAWHDPDNEPHAIYGAAITEDGKIATPAKRLTDSPKNSRYPSLLPLGDRVMMLYADNRDQNQGYEIYARMLDASLAPLSPETRITQAPGDSVYPVASFGPEGDVGVLFRDDRLDGQHVYFTRLQCVSE